MPKASEKTKSKLYKIVDNQIMDARIEVQKIITDPKQFEKVDDILFKLNYMCPQAVIDYFSQSNKP